MKDSTVLFMIFTYNLAIIALSCYMAVSFSPWWALLLVLTQFRFERKDPELKEGCQCHTQKTETRND